MKLFMTLILTMFCSTLFAQAPFVPTATTADITYSQGVGAQAVSRNSNYTVVALVTDDNPAAGSFTCAVTDICTKATHGYLTGLKVVLSTSNTLPAGLSPGTYYIVKLTANTFNLATSLANATASTPVIVDITDTGTGAHTVTPSALAGASVKIQGSMDGTNYADMPIRATGDATRSATITGTANFYLDEKGLNVNYVRLYYTMTAGQISISQIPKVFKAVTAPY